MKKHNLRKKLVGIGASLLCSLMVFQAFETSVYASENTNDIESETQDETAGDSDEIADGQGAGFSVRANLPENQYDTYKSYFDLMLEPGEEQILEVEIRNSNSTEMVVSADINSATTNTNGVVEYGYRDIEQDETLQYNLKDLIEVEENITLAPYETYTLEMKLRMPEEEFDGILAGGITMMEVKQEEEDAEEASGTQMVIENKYAYVIGIVLRTNENEVEAELDLTKVFPNQLNARNVISSNLHNAYPVYVNQLEVEAEVTRKGETEVLYSASKEMMQMAPNSNFDFPVSLNGERMEAGDYTMHLTARSKGKEWSWSEDFTITREEAEAFNELDVTIERTDYTRIFIIIGAAVLVLAIVAILVVKSRKNTAKLKAELEAAQAKNRKDK